MHTEIKITNAMINIEGIQVDVVGSLDSLLQEWAVFTVEFEYDSRMMVCHTFGWTVKRGIARLINRIFGPKVEGVDLRQSLANSKYITVKVECSFAKNRAAVLTCKYELIKDNATYSPYGYNFLLLVNSGIEKSYAFNLYCELIDSINANRQIPESKGQRGKASRPVYQYDKETGGFMCEFSSIKEAAQHLGICATSINMCCNGHIKSAGNYIWSYCKEPAVSTVVDNRRKQATEVSTEERNKIIEERRQKFIRENMK